MRVERRHVTVDLITENGRTTSSRWDEHWWTSAAI